MKFIDIDDTFSLYDILSKRFENHTEIEDFVKKMQIHDNVINYYGKIIAYSIQGDEVFYTSDCETKYFENFKSMIIESDGNLLELTRPLTNNEKFDLNTIEGRYYVHKGEMRLFK